MHTTEYLTGYSNDRYKGALDPLRALRIDEKYL